MVHAITTPEHYQHTGYSYCSTMHNTSAQLWRAFLRRNYITENFAYGGQHQRGATAHGFCSGPWLKPQSKHENCSIKQLRWMWFRLHGASQGAVRINEMYRSKMLLNSTIKYQLYSLRTFYKQKRYFLRLWETKKTDFFRFHRVRPGHFYVFRHRSNFNSNSSYSYLMLRCFFDLTVLACYAIRDHINLNHLTSGELCGGWCLVMTVPPDIHRFIFSVALLTPINLPVSNSWQDTTRGPNNDFQPLLILTHGSKLHLNIT